MQWRCSGCGKLSEGFALPYGRCPHCGGRCPVRRRARCARRGRAARRAHGLRDRAGRPGLLPACRRRQRRPIAARAVRPLRGDGRRAHGDAGAALPPRRARSVARLSAGGGGLFADVPHRPQDPDNLFRIAIALEQRAAAFFTSMPRPRPKARPSAPVPRAGGRGAGARRHAGHRARALAAGPAGPVRRRRFGPPLAASADG
jgi:glutamate synthase (NADPH/NADH) small chain